MATQDDVIQAKLDAEMSLLIKLKEMADGKHTVTAIETVARAYRAVAGGAQPTSVSVGK